MKMDIEGFELDALQGALAAFVKAPPCVLMVEWTPVKLRDGVAPLSLFEHMRDAYGGLYEFVVEFANGDVLHGPMRPALESRILGVAQASGCNTNTDTNPTWRGAGQWL